MLDRLRLDLRFVARSLRRTPGFTTVAVLTLALGIGLTTTVASIADHVLVRGLPFHDAGRLVTMLEEDDHGALRTPSPPTVADWARDPGVMQAFDGIDFIRGDGVSIRVGDAVETVGCAFAGPAFFDLLGARASRGRVLIADDHRLDAPAVAVISHKLWVRRFASAPDVIGRTITVDSVPTTIVGVLPAGAVYPPFADIWMSLARYKHPEILQRRGLHVDSRTMGRLRAGVDSSRAATSMRVVGSRLAASYPAEQRGWRPAMIPLQLEIVGNIRPMLLTLGGAALAVLLLVCANVAGLLLARSTSRSRELSVRRALGASHGRVAAQLFIETLAVVVVGGIVGAGVAVAGVMLARKFGAARIPRVDELSLDWRAMVVAAAMTIVTALLCGLWPAIRAARVSSMSVLRASAHGSVGVRSESRMRRLLVTLQFAIAVVLLIGAGLLLQSFRRASTVNVGFDPSDLVTLRVRPPNGSYAKPEDAQDLYIRLMNAARAVPGVVDAAFINHAPFYAASIYTTISIPGRAALDSSNQVFYRTVSDSYLRTMRMSMKAGRWFSVGDIRSRSSVFVINEAMAKLYWPSANPVGQPLTVTRASQGRPDFGQPITGTVIGVVADVHQRGQDVPPDVEVYVPFTLETWPWGSIIVRTRDGARAIPALARAIAAVDSRLVGPGAAADGDFGVMETAIAGTLAARKLSTSLIGGFAVCALLLAAIGMYGVVAYSITQRTREIGVRKAIGATDRDIASLMLGESARIVAAGVLLGVAVTWGGGRLIQSLLFNTGTGDPVAYVGTIVLLAAVALLATYLPARAAMRLSPTIAMRSD